MRRMDVAKLNQIAAQYGGKYVEEKFKGGSTVDRSLVMNTIAHGFWMGARFFEGLIDPRPWRRVWPEMRLPYTSLKIEKKANGAAIFYLKKQGYSKLSWPEQMLIRATVSRGFVDGFNFRYDVHVNPKKESA